MGQPKSSQRIGLSVSAAPTSRGVDRGATTPQAVPTQQPAEGPPHSLPPRSPWLLAALMAVEEIGGSLGSLKGDDPDGLNLVRHNSVTALRAHGLGEDRFGFLFLDCELACHIDPSITLPLVRVRTMRRWGGSPIA